MLNFKDWKENDEDGDDPFDDPNPEEEEDEYWALT